MRRERQSFFFCFLKGFVCCVDCYFLKFNMLITCFVISWFHMAFVSFFWLLFK